MDERFIYERLKALSGGIERDLYRDISKAFAEVVKYNNSALDDLKVQINEELRDVSERFYLYGAVTTKSDAPMVNDFLFPMSEDLAPDSIGTIFCQCPLSDMEEIFSEEHVMVIETEDGSVETAVRIRPCQRYLKKIEWLKKTFYENGIFWRTPYLPYVSKFGDVYCDSFNIEKEMISIRFKDKDIPAKCDLIPLWNVEKIKLKCTVFPIPAIDEQNYKHTLRVPYAQDGYAADMEQSVKNIYYNHEGMIIVTEEKMQRDFDVCRIAIKRDINVPHYPLTTNYRRMRHIDRQAERSMVNARSRADIGRIVGTYEAADELQFLGIEEGRTGNIKGCTDQYGFSSDGRKDFTLKFSADKQTFITMDLCAFLVSEVQTFFPEFAVTGELCRL